MIMWLMQRVEMGNLELIRGQNKRLLRWVSGKGTQPTQLSRYHHSHFMDEKPETWFKIIMANSKSV